MDCVHCGAAGREGSFCNECGGELIEPQPAVCSSCGADDQRGNFCHMCGTKHDHGNTCPSCKANNQVGNFCKICGTQIQRASDVEANKGQDSDEEFDPGVVRCRACGGLSHRYRSPGEKVDYCSLCGVGRSHLNFLA